MQPEARISRAIINVLRAKGQFAFKVHGSALMMGGLPDVIACVHGRFIGLEVKQPEHRQRVSAKQRYVMQRIERAGGITGVVTSVNEAMKLIGEEDA